MHDDPTDREPDEDALLELRFGVDMDEDYFAQFTSEKLPQRAKKVPKRTWVKRPGRREI